VKKKLILTNFHNSKITQLRANPGVAIPSGCQTVTILVDKGCNLMICTIYTVSKQCIKR